jgi:DNA-binding PucR family transcriptional regulator
MAVPIPPPRVRELIRQGAEQVLQLPDEWFQAIDEATLLTPRAAEIAADPALSEAIRRANYNNVMAWATANIRAPGDPVPANTSPTQLQLARDLVRRGLDQAILDSHRAGQGAAWQRWMRICFGLTRDPGELEGLLAVTAASIQAFVDETIAAVAERMDSERDTLTRGSEGERRDLVALILQGAPVSRTRADALLRYDLNGAHTAAVVWSPEHDCDLGRLERTAEALMQATSARQRVTVLAATTTIWVWLSATALPDREELDAALRRTAEVRVALGGPAGGIEGFRRSHHDAIETQRFMAKPGRRAPRVVVFTDIQLASLSTQDAARAERYVKEVLGDLAEAPRELRDTVSTYLAEFGNASATAARLITHRNTVLRRLARADQLLPRPLREDPLQIGVALEMVRWHTPTTQSSREQQASRRWRSGAG